ncbi:MAG: glycine cleavage system protein GcvH [Hyphomicrobiaceae bacterium]|nr:glycine cleavage system protein GcvH [Hyphomicrobiaceae bacterium]
MAQEYFSKDHEYLRVSGDTATVGITLHAQKELGDVVFVEGPEIGQHFKAGEAVAVVESVKAASEIYSPIDGLILEVNTVLESNPALVNEDAEGAAWFFKLKIIKPDQLTILMSRTDYEKFIAESI